MEEHLVESRLAQRDVHESDAELVDPAKHLGERRDAVGGGHRDGVGLEIGLDTVEIGQRGGDPGRYPRVGRG